MTSPDDVMDMYVPGDWTCPKCAFSLSQQTLFMGSGEVGCTRDQVMNMTGEFCPNDGELMRRTTWRERAEDNRQWGESLMEDIISAVCAEHLPGALEAIKRHYKSLQSIAANSCCQPCREAALVAQHALEPPPSSTDGTLAASEGQEPPAQTSEWRCKTCSMPGTEEECTYCGGSMAQLPALVERTPGETT